MHRVHRSVIVPYSQGQMFALVQDVAQYPKFLPWCSASHVRPQPNKDVVEARIEITYMGVYSHFTTSNAHRFPESITLTLIDGPFRELRGEWSFRALGEDASKVSLELHYRFSAGVLGRAIAPVFERVANSLVDAFAARAQDLYGEVTD